MRHVGRTPHFFVVLATALLVAVVPPVPTVAATTYDLVLQQGPAPAYASRPFTLRLAIIDFGQSPPIVVTPDTSATVTLTIASSPSAGAVLACDDGLSRRTGMSGAEAGTVTFSGCTIDRPGTGFQLAATASGVESSSGPPPVINPAQFRLDVAPETEAPQPTIGLSLTHSGNSPFVTWGETVTVHAVFSRYGANKPFQLQQSTRSMQTWVPLADLVTDARGVATFSYRPSVTARLRAVYAGSPDLKAGASVATGFLLFSLARQVPTNAVPRVIRVGAQLTFTTTVRPLLPDLAPARVAFRIYHRVSGDWKLVSLRYATADLLGVARLALRFRGTGEWYVRSSAQPRWFGEPEEVAAVAWASRPTPMARVSVR